MSCAGTEVWEQRRHFPQEFVGGWRKDEVQWMSLALVGDRKGIQPQNSALLPLMECTFPPLLFLHRRPFSWKEDR